MNYIKTSILFFTMIVSSSWHFQDLNNSVSTGHENTDCTFNGYKLYGRIQFVESFPDIKVQVVSAFPDLKVKIVDAFPDNCGEWQIVDAFPDLKVKMVNAFPDIKIQYVDAFPGM